VGWGESVLEEAEQFKVEDMIYKVGTSLKEMVEVWKDMEKALNQGGSPEDDQLQDDGGSGGVDRDRLQLQYGGRRRQSSQDFLDLRSKFENNEMDRNDDKIREFEQSQNPEVRISFPEQVGGPPMAVVRRQNVLSKWRNRNTTILGSQGHGPKNICEKVAATKAKGNIFPWTGSSEG
jgi:hypothetical protein